MRLVATTTALAALGAAAFVLGRGTVGPPRDSNPLRLVDGMPIGVLHTRAGALAAADNYAAVMLNTRLQPRRLSAFAKTLVEPSARGGFVRADTGALERESQLPDSKAIGSVLAHRLVSYNGRTADVATWNLGSYWGTELAPTQYWVISDLRLHWDGGRWMITALQESVPGPVPALIGGKRAASTATAWTASLVGMSAPYYGDR